MNKPKFDIIIQLKLIAFWVFTLVAILTFFNSLGFRYKRNLFWISKTSISAYYGINERTLTRWINCFLSPELQAQCTNKRKIPIDALAQIFKKFGHTSDYPILSRKAIVEISQSTHRSLIRTVTFIGKKHELPTELLASLRVFPPSYSKIIAEAFGLYKSEIDDYFNS